MTGEPSQFPFPVASGGSPNIAIGRALRLVPPGDVRQPDLKQAPQVVSATGFGTGSGAFIVNNGSDADQSQGLVRILVGLAPSASGVVTLYFPVAPAGGQYVAFADWSAALSPVASVNNLSMAWTATRPLVTGERLLLAYQWAISR